MRASRVGPLILLAFMAGPSVAAAHDVVVEQIVNVRIHTDGGRPLVDLQIPLAVLPGPKRPDLEGMPILAADVARNLDLQQNARTVALASASARVAPDGRSVDVALVYAADASAPDLSARLNAFESTPLKPVRTTVRYQPPNGPEQTVSVIGPPSRVRFDPPAPDVVRQFVKTALTSVLTTGDHVLFLACLLLCSASGRAAARPFAALAGAQLLGMVLVALAPGAVGALLPAAALVAASAIVIAALQDFVEPRPGWVLAVAAIFGIVNGSAFGSMFSSAQSLAGAHQALALAAFAAFVIGAQLWLGAVMAAIRRSMDAFGAPGRVAALVMAALIVHNALHLVAERA